MNYLNSIKKSRVLIAIYEMYYKFRYYVFKFLYFDNYQIMSDFETIEYIEKFQPNVSRIGDGEMDIICNRNIGFQKADNNLANDLEKVLLSKRKGMLICVIDAINNDVIEELSYESRKFWMINLGLTFNKWRKYLHKKTCYGNAHITRPYIRYKNDKLVALRFEKIRNIWNNKRVLIVEGEGTRIGVGNDFMDNASEIHRIICPNKNAYEIKNIIKNKIIEYNQKNNYDMVLIALGPTASILAYELLENQIWSLDVGHIDLEYEYWRRNMKNGGNIEIKYVDDSREEYNQYAFINDYKYLSSILENLNKL
ncbi:MAG: GT-D fold domain-containing glycosyltransferase [Bacilli bacterium]